MKKRSTLIFGLLAALLAFSMVLAGCKDPNGDEGDAGWPAAMEATWKHSQQVTATVIGTSALGSTITTWGGSTFKLDSITDGTYTVKPLTSGDGLSFKAVVSGDGNTLTISASTDTIQLKDGNYAKQ